MKQKIILFILPVLLLSSCSFSNSSSAQKEIELGCDKFISGYTRENGFQVPREATLHFAKASRLDPRYIPLAQAVQTLTRDKFVYMSVGEQDDWTRSNNLVWGTCSK